MYIFTANKAYNTIGDSYFKIWDRVIDILYMYQLCDRDFLYLFCENHVKNIEEYYVTGIQLGTAW